MYRICIHIYIHICIYIYITQNNEEYQRTKQKQVAAYQALVDQERVLRCGVMNQVAVLQVFSDCDTLQQYATHGNTLQHTTTHYKMQQ